MPASIAKSQIIEESSLVYTTTKKTKRRVYQVKDLTGSTDAEIEVAALAVSGIPAEGAALGGSAPLDTMYAVGFDVKRTSPTEAKIIVTYESPTDQTGGGSSGGTNPLVATWDGGSVLVQGVTPWTTPSAAARIAITYNSATVSGTAVVDNALVTSRATVVKSLSGALPETIVDLAANKISSATFRGRAAGKMKCVSVTFRPYPAIVTGYEFTFEFLYNPTGHLPLAIYRDDTGQVPNDVDASNGTLALTTYYATYNFTTLGIGS